MKVTTSFILSFLASYPTWAMILLALFYTTSSSLVLSCLVIFDLSSFIYLLDLDPVFLLDLGLYFPLIY